MPSVTPLRSILAALGLAALLSACAEPPPPAPPPTAPPPPPPPAVSLSPRVIEQAAAYRRYMAMASEISPAFADGSAVAQGLKTGVAYEPPQLLRGAIAYGAVAALQDPTFVAEVRAFVVNPEQRRSVAAAIIRDPAYAIGINGSAGAAGLVQSALAEDGRRLLVQGRAVKQAAYDVQRAAWSKRDVEAHAARLAAAKQLSATPLLPETAEAARLQQAVQSTGSLGLTASPASPPYTAVVTRALAVAALSALGQATDENLAQVMPILAEPGAASCLNMSKLNLYQCLAVSKPHYEDVFCLGQHVMMDTGMCVIKGAGVAVPDDPLLAARIAAAAAEAAAKPPPRRPARKR